MSYVPTCQQDVFVSYAYANDTATNGLIGHCGDRLRDLVLQYAPRCQFFLDERENALQAGSTIPQQIMDAASQSAVMVIFYSKAYRDSDWCKRELHEYCSAGNKAIYLLALEPESDPRRDHRVAISQRKARALYGTRTEGGAGARFSHLEPPAAVTNQAGRTLEDELTSLAGEMAADLKVLRDNSAAQRVHISWWREDVEAHANDLINRLESRRTVVTTTSHVVVGVPDDRAESLDEVAKADLYVEMRGNAEEPPTAAAEALKALSAHAGNKTLRWFSKSGAAQTPFVSAESDVVATPSEFFDSVWKKLGSLEAEKRLPENPGADTAAAGGFRRHVLVIAVNRDKDAAAVLLIDHELAKYRQSHGVGRDVFFIEEYSAAGNMAVLPSEWLTPVENRLRRDRASGIVFVHAEAPGRLMDQLLRDFLYAKADRKFPDLRSSPGICEFTPRPKMDRFYRPPPPETLEFDDSCLHCLQAIATA